MREKDDERGIVRKGTRNKRKRHANRARGRDSEEGTQTDEKINKKITRI